MSFRALALAASGFGIWAWVQGSRVGVSGFGFQGFGACGFRVWDWVQGSRVWGGFWVSGNRKPLSSHWPLDATGCTCNDLWQQVQLFLCQHLGNKTVVDRAKIAVNQDAVCGVYTLPTHKIASHGLLFG